MADQEAPSTEPTAPQTDREKLFTWLSSNTDVKGSRDWNNAVAAYNREAQKEGLTTFQIQMLPIQDPTAEMGFIEGMIESATGTARQTEETRRLPNYTRMPELQAILDIDAAQTKLGLASAAPEEMASIIKAQFPDVEISQDLKGNYMLRSGVDGQEYIIKPGFGEGDFKRFLGQTALAVPASMAVAAGTTLGLPAVLAGMGLYGLSAAGYQLYQKSIGGEFNAFDVAAEALIPPGFEAAAGALKRAASNVTNAIKSTYSKSLNRFRPPEEVGTQANRTDEEIQRLLNRAKDGDVTAQQELAAMSKVDPEVIAAANSLGIAEYLQPDHVSSDRQFIELMQLIKSWKGSAARDEELAGLEQIGKNIIERVHTLGAQTPGNMSEEVAGRLRATIDQLKVREDELWDTVRGTIDAVQGSRIRKGLPPLEHNPQELLGRIRAEVETVPGKRETNLPTFKKDFLRDFAPKEVLDANGNVIRVEYPRIEAYETFRRDLSSGMGKTGRYMNEAAGDLRTFYMQVLEEERKALAEQLPIQTRGRPLAFDPDDPISAVPNLLEDFDLARATSELRFGAIDDQISLFGKKVQDSLPGSESLVGGLSAAMKPMTTGTAENFLNLMNAVPEDMRTNVALTGLRMMFGTSAKTGGLNFGTFSKWYEGVLANKPTYDALKQYLPPETMKMFDDVYKVSRGVTQALQERVNTGATMQLTEFLTAEGVMSQVYEMAKNVGKTGAAEVVSTTMGQPGLGLAAVLIRGLSRPVSQESRKTAQQQALNAADALLTSPSFMNMITQQFSDESIRRFSASRAWQTFANKVGLPPSSGEGFVRSIYAASSTAVTTGETMSPEMTEEDVTLTLPPQARVAPPAPQTRGVPGMGAGTTAPEPETAAPTGPVSPSSREMLQQLFPTDFIA